MSTLRISGIASGMDTETMVRDLMKAERMRLNKFTQSKQITQWRQEQYNNVNKDFANFIIDMRKELGLTTTTSSGLTLSNSTSNLNWVKKASSSNESVFTATATSGAISGNHKIKVNSLAEGVNIASRNAVIIGSGEEETPAKSTNTLEDLGLSSSGLVKFEISSGATVQIDYSSTDTIGDIVKKINNAKTADGKTSLGLQASFDSTTGRLFLSTKNTGESAQIKVTADEGGLFTGENNIFKLNDANGDAILEVPTIDGEGVITDPGKFSKGNDAEIEFNGATGLKYSSNTFTINGIQINLNNIPSKTDEEFSIRVDTDVDGVFNKIKTFVDKYNELIDKMNGITSQKRYKDYLPLTAEQKESLSDEEIKKWETMAQSGLLKNDEFITRTLDTMRNGLYKPVEGLEGSFDFITSIGISTSDWKDKGKLTIDEAKLKNAIAGDVDGVLNLLFKKPDTSITGKEDKRNQSGLITRLFDDIVVGMKDIISKSGTGENSNLYRNVQSNILIDFVTSMGSISYLDKDIANVEKSLSREEANLSRREDSYWKRFTAMEKALQQMSSQSAWLMQQFGGGQY